MSTRLKRRKLLENQPRLEEAATLTKRRKLLLTKLDAVYADTVEEKAIVAIKPKPAFRALFEIATTRAGSGAVLVNEPPQTSYEPEAGDLCFWWRRGRVELHQKQRLIVAISPNQFTNILWHRGPAGSPANRENFKILQK